MKAAAASYGTRPGLPVPEFILALLLILALPGLAVAQEQDRGLPPTNVFFSKFFSPSTIGPGSVSTLTFEIASENSVQVTDLAFTDTLPAALTIATPAFVFNTCGGTVTAPEGGSTITLSGGTIAGFGSCDITVDVTGSTLGSHQNVSGDLTSSAGNSGPALATLTISGERPGFSKSFAPGSVQFGGGSRLTFTIDNSANGGLESNLSFSDDLPPGLEIASPAGAANTCNGTLTAPSGGTTISLFGGFLTAGSTCTISVDLSAGAVGELDNRTSDLTSSAGSSGKASDRLEVFADQLALTKEFVDDPTAPGQTTVVEFSLRNLSRAEPATDIAFTDDLDATLTGLVALGTPVSEVCGAGSQLSGTDLLSLTGASLAPGEICTFEVALQVPAGATPGSFPNTTSSVTATIGGDAISGSPATDTLVVDVFPLLEKSFLDNPVGAGETTELEFTITNSSSTFAASNIAFSDAFDAILPSAVSVPADGFCGAGSTASFSPGSSFSSPTLNVSGANLAPGSSCTFSIVLDVATGAPTGAYPNQTSEITATVDGATRTGPPAEDTLEVVGAPNLSKEFTDDPVDPGGTVSLEFTLVNGGGESGLSDTTGIAFTDDLDAALSGLVATGLPMTDVCGTGSQISGTSVLSFTGGSLSPGESCSFVVTLQVPVGVPAGFHTNTTSEVTATVGGVPVTGPAATDDLLISGVELTKEFIDDPVIAGSTATLRFELLNDNPDSAASDISFTDDLDAALSGLAATGLPMTDVCGAGSSVSGTTNLVFSGGNLPAGEACSFDVTAQVPPSAATGDYQNITSPVTAILGGSLIQFSNATDLLSVNNDLIGLEKVFTDDPAVPGGTVTLEFTVTNLSAAETITDIAFTDDLDAALTGLQSESGSQSDVCGTGSLLSGTSVLAFTGGSLGPSESCTFSATLRLPGTISVDGNVLNTTSTASGAVGGLAVQGASATDVLIINQAAFSKAFASAGAPSGTVELQFTIDNLSASQSLSSVAFIDDLEAVLPGLVAVNTPLADPCGVGSTLTGSSVLTLSGGSVEPGSSCTFSVLLEVPAGTSPGSYVNVTSDLTTGGLFLSDPASANLSIQPPPTFGKVFAPNTIALDGLSTLSFQIDNTGSTLAADSMTFVDNLPAGVEVAATPNIANGCGGSVTAAPGGGTIELSGGSVSAGASCSIEVDVTAPAEGSFDNVTGSLVSSNGDSGTASDTLDVVSDEFGFSKSFRTAPVVPGGLVELELSVVNGSAFPLAEIAFTDDLDAALPGLVAEGLPQADSCGAGSQASGTSVITLTGGNLPAGGSCTIVVPVRVPADAVSGTYVNATSTATAVRESVAVEAPSASAELVVESVGFGKAFDVVRTGAGSSVTMSLTISNPDPANAISSLEFTDDLDAFLSGAAASNTPINDVCGAGSLLDGTSVVTLTDGRLPGGGSCTMNVTVAIPSAAAAGEYINSTSALGGDVVGTPFSVEGGSAGLVIEVAPLFSKSFSPDVMAVESVSTLTFVIDNSASQLSADSLAFTDNLPAGLEVAATPAVSNTCGGTVAASAAATTIELTGGSVAAGASCQIQVDVTTDDFGDFDNVTDDLTSSLGNSGQATATLTINDDLDGVPGSIEDQAPNGGDGNNDGTPDRIQSDVASLPTFDGSTFMTLIITDGCDQLNNVVAVDPASQPPAPEEIRFPFGLVAFELPCETAVIDVVFHDSGGSVGRGYWKYGPVLPGDTATADWYEFSGQPAGAPTGATGSTNVWTLVLADDELGDDTGNDGVIVDQGGPVSLMFAVPGLSGYWMLLLMLSLLMTAGLWHVRTGNRVEGKKY